MYEISVKFNLSKNIVPSNRVYIRIMTYKQLIFRRATGDDNNDNYYDKSDYRMAFLDCVPAVGTAAHDTIIQ